MAYIVKARTVLNEDTKVLILFWNGVDKYGAFLNILAKS